VHPTSTREVCTRQSVVLGGLHSPLRCRVVHKAVPLQHEQTAYVLSAACGGCHRKFLCYAMVLIIIGVGC
jgi:hypothetical protein